MTETLRSRTNSFTRSEIKAVAHRHLAERGLNQVSLRAIAAELGVTAPALYRYFPGRDALITALVVDAYDSLANHLNAAAANPNPDERFLDVGRAYRNWAKNHAADFALIFGTPLPDYQAPDRTLSAARRSLAVLLDSLMALNRQWPDLSAELKDTHSTMYADLGGHYPHGVIHEAALIRITLQGFVLSEVFGQFDTMFTSPDAVFEDLLGRLVQSVTGETAW